jgi:hypothetical protein
MLRHRTLLLVLSFILSVSGCTTGRSSPTPQAQLPAIATATEVQPESTPLPTSTVLTSPTPDLPGDTPRLSQYNLEVFFNYTNHHLAVSEEIEYLNPSPEVLSDLLLIVEPLQYPGVFSIQELQVDGSPVSITPEGNQIRLPLAKPLPPGMSTQIAIQYRLDLPSPQPDPSIRPIPFGYTPNQVNLVDWYPFIPPYVPGKGWLANPPWYYGEHLAYDLADFTVRIRLDESRQGIVFAASAPAESTGDWLEYHHLSARNFAWSASHLYQVEQTTVGNTTISSYFFPGHVLPGKAALQTTSESLQLYNHLFGEYTRPTLAVVEADFLDGMEFDGLYFLSDGFYNLYTGTPAEYLTTIAAHETAHQWWYAALGNDQANEPWLDEALCTYSERIFYEHLYPESLDWWWDYRIQYYQPQGWVDTSIYNPFGSAQPYASYRAAVYLNGSVFLEDLRTRIGEQAFFSFLAAYATQNRGALVSGDTFFDELARHSQVNIQDLLDIYFFNR